MMQQAGLFPSFDLLFMYSRLHPMLGMQQILVGFSLSLSPPPSLPTVLRLGESINFQVLSTYACILDWYLYVIYFLFLDRDFGDIMMPNLILCLNLSRCSTHLDIGLAY